VVVELEARTGKTSTKDRSAGGKHAPRQENVNYLPMLKKEKYDGSKETYHRGAKRAAKHGKIKRHQNISKQESHNRFVCLKNDFDTQKNEIKVPKTDANITTRFKILEFTRG